MTLTFVVCVEMLEVLKPFANHKFSFLTASGVSLMGSVAFEVTSGTSSTLTSSSGFFRIDFTGVDAVELGAFESADLDALNSSMRLC